MALVGKWTKIEKVQTNETVQEVISYPIFEEGHHLFDKSGTTETVEVPKMETIETVYDNVYVVVHSINSWKSYGGVETMTLFNICFRVYNNQQDRLTDYDSFIYEDHLVGKELKYDTKEIEQAYALVNNVQGFEELVNDN
jgi:hypothetical protein